MSPIPRRSYYQCKHIGKHMFGSIDGALKCSGFTIKTILAMYFSYRERHIVFPDNLIVINVFATVSLYLLINSFNITARQCNIPEHD